MLRHAKTSRVTAAWVVADSEKTAGGLGGALEVHWKAPRSELS